MMIESYNESAQYLRALWEKTGLSQRKLAEIIGVEERTFRNYLNPRHASKHPYSVQIAIESYLFFKDRELIYNALVCYEFYLQNPGAQTALKTYEETTGTALKQDGKFWVADTVEKIDSLLELFNKKEAV